MISAQDGNQGLEQVKTHLPDLIISEILMPNMDGFEFCHSIRALPDGAKTPVLYRKKRKSISDQAFRHRKSPPGRCR